MLIGPTIKCVPGRERCLKSVGSIAAEIFVTDTHIDRFECCPKRYVIIARINYCRAVPIVLLICNLQSILQIKIIEGF